MANNINEIQESINNLYIEKFKNYKGGIGLSVPHIPRISPKYIDNRTIILGQETNTWYRKTDDDLKNIFLKSIDDISKVCLTDRYDKFIDESIEKYGGKFWDFNKLLYKQEILNGNLVSDRNLSHCWVNLFTIEACRNKKDKKGRPTVNRILANEIMDMQGDLLYQIFKILKPRLIISLTGHSLDDILLKNALNTKESFKQIDNILTKDMLGEIVIKDNNNHLFETRVIRCYHPSYFMARINTHKGLKQKIKSHEISFSNSKYYTETLIRNLEKIKDNIWEVS